MGCRWQFYIGRVRSETGGIGDCIRTSHTLFWFALFAFLLLVGFWVPVTAARVAAIAEDCVFPRFGRGRLGKIEGGSKGKVLWIA